MDSNHGLAFHPYLVPQVLDGTKTQTRHLGGLEEVNQDRYHFTYLRQGPQDAPGLHFFNCQEKLCRYHQPAGFVRAVPPYAEGDVVPMLEPWAEAPPSEDGRPFLYEADGGDFFLHVWKPAKEMPAGASRAKLEILSVSAERAHDITGPDCIAEGVQMVDRFGKPYFSALGTTYDTPREAFITLIDAVMPRTWIGNPWWWAITFKVLK